MTYKILEINKSQGWVKLEVVFDDGVKYEKRMMAPVDSDEAIDGAIKQWLADYIPEREKENSYNPSQLVNKTFTFSKDDLPKSNIEINAEREAELARIKADELKAEEEKTQEVT